MLFSSGYKRLRLFRKDVEMFGNLPAAAPRPTASNCWSKGCRVGAPVRGATPSWCTRLV